VNNLHISYNILSHYNYIQYAIWNLITLLLFYGSGVTRVGDNRNGNWGCHPCIYYWKTCSFLVASSAVSPLISSSQNWRLFCSSLYRFLLLSRGCHPSQGCHPTLFYLSDLVSPLFFVNLPTIFFLRVSPPWRVSPRAVSSPRLVTPLVLRTCIRKVLSKRKFQTAL